MWQRVGLLVTTLGTGAVLGLLGLRHHEQGFEQAHDMLRYDDNSASYVIPSIIPSLTPNPRKSFSSVPHPRRRPLFHHHATSTLVKPAWDTVDTVLKHLKQGTVVYDVPANMEQDSATKVVVALQPGQDKLTITGLSKDAVSVKKVPLGEWMRAKLEASSDAFTVTSLAGDEVQPVAWSMPTQWQWEVVPKKQGRWTLTLRLDYVQGTPDHPSWTRNIKVLERNVYVKVRPATFIAQILSFLLNQWSKLLAVGASGLAFMTWLKTKKKKP